jgi:pseudouridine-5'-monophosphatase
VRCAIFDLDGVLLDTEHFYTDVTEEICRGYGKVFDWSIKRNMIGRPSIESARYLVGALSLPITPEEYLERRAVRLEQLFEKSLEKPGAEAFTRLLASRGVPIAVATSTERHLLARKILQHADWFSVFDAIVVGDDPRVKKGKPAPDTFLVAAGELGMKPEECVVFEDAPAGLEAAHAAGMQVVAIPDEMMDRDAYTKAELVIDRYADITPEDLGL